MAYTAPTTRTTGTLITASIYNTDIIDNISYLYSKAVKQVVNTQTGALATGTTTVPYDDTIPQNTEGTEFMTLAITPLSATSKLKIDVVLIQSYSVASAVICALFQDSTANALAGAMAFGAAGGEPRVMSFRHYMTSGTTSSTTFKVRAGGNNAGTITINGNSGSRILGGVMASSITIMEI